MMPLAQQVCLRHPEREAVARCVRCSDFFCRECIIEHEGRLVCGSCLGALTKRGPTGSSRWAGVVRTALNAMLGFLCAWICFYELGRMLLAMPSEFHKPAIFERMEGNSSDE